jgi:8-amino-7-oxononanoate synthase
MDQKLRLKLDKRTKEQTLRFLSIPNGSIDFFSNDYLGLAQIKEEFSEQPKRFGSTGSRLLSGNSLEALQTEKSIATFFNAESSLVFNSGYSANLALLSSVPQRGDTVFYDEYVHASIRDGIRLSHANAVSFKHNDLKDLENKITKSVGSVYIVIESLYSMDGDMAPLKGITELSEKNNAYLIVDEAHAVGVFGWEGRGLVHGMELNDKVFARVITFGKAYGFHGAAILGSKELINYLVNFARPFIYTTALPLTDYLEIEKKVLRPEIRERQKTLHDNIAYFRSRLNLKTNSEINSPIQVFQFTSKDEVLKKASLLSELGIYTKPIFAPTVPDGKECIRLCFHSFNTRNEIDLLLNSF